jgi:hypothetical protein
MKIISLLTLCIFQLPLFAQNNSESEKIFIHTDRDTYFEGDTLWAKLYLFDAETHAFSQKSKIVYIGIVDKADQVLYQEKILVTEGQASLYIVIPKNPSTSFYRLVAYTNWMLNFDAAFLFQKKINIISQEPPKTYSEKHDLQFYPEGGKLIHGLKTRVGFKCTHESGKGENIKGQIVNEIGEVLTEFSSAHLGIGSFYFTPDMQKSYRAIYYFRGKEFSVPLPKIYEKGYHLQVDYLGRQKGLLIQVQNTAEEKEKLTIVADQRGKILIQHDLKQGSKNHKFILKDSLPDGIINVSLRHENGTTLAERTILIHDLDIKIDLGSKFEKIQPSERLTFEFDLQNNLSLPIKEAFVSVSVLDAGQANLDTQNPNMSAYMLVNSDLKGPIEDPNSYFEMPLAQRAYCLDNLMLTHGWSNIISKAPTINQEVENELVLTGIVYKNDKKLRNETVFLSIWDQNGFRIKTLQTNEEGKIKLGGNWFGDISLLILDKKSKELSLKLEPKDFKFPENAFNNTTEANIEQNILRKQHEEYIDLAELTVKGKKIELLKDDSRRSLYGGEPDMSYVISPEMSSGATDIAQLLEGRIVGIAPGSLSQNSNGDLPQSNLGIDQGGSSGNSGPPPAGSSAAAPSASTSANAVMSINKVLILVDGVRIPASFLKSIPVNMVDRVDLLRDVAKTSMYGLEAGNGKVINILTKKHSDVGTSLSSKFITKEIGIRTHKEVFTALYPLLRDKADVRAMLYWNPQVRTGLNGKFKIALANNSIAKKLLISVECTDGKGNFGSKTFYVGD